MREFSASTITVASDIDISILQSQLKAQQLQIDALLAASEKPTTSTMSAKTSIGGYGEAHYYNYENATQQYDAYRFVLYVGHKFSDTVRLHSELEVEHGLVADTDATCTIKDDGDKTLEVGEVVCGSASTKLIFPCAVSAGS